MIFGNCNLKIIDLSPRLDRNSLGDYYFSAGVKKDFAKQCYERELKEQTQSNLQNTGRAIFRKVFRPNEYLPLFDNTSPYCFFENKKGNLTCLIKKIVVPGNSCNLISDSQKNIEKELQDINKQGDYIKYTAKNVDNPSQAYTLLSLLTSWENITDSIINPIVK